MTVESNYAIARLSYWLKILSHFFNPSEAKPKPMQPILHARFSRALGKLQVIPWNSDWFIALFTSVVNGRRIVNREDWV